MGGWLLHDLQQGVERLRAQHVHFIDDVKLVGHARRHESRVGDEFTDFVDTVVTGTIDFDDVDVLTAEDRVDGFLGQRFVTVQGRAMGHQLTGEDAGGGRLSDTASAAEEIGVRGPL